VNRLQASMKFPNPVNFAKALWRMAYAWMHGLPLFVDNHVALRRRNECRSRDGDCYDAVSGQCQVCTCWVTTKTLVATERCPRGHWKREFIKTT
jgi:hypothetical protein